MTIESAVSRPWLAHYPAGRPFEINPNEYSSLVDLLLHHCNEYKDAAAFTNMGKTISYHELDQLTADFAAWLHHGAHLKKGDRIALMMPNLLQYPITMLGALRAGLVVVNTNPLYTAHELQHQLCDSGAVAIVVLENFANFLPMYFRPLVLFVIRYTNPIHSSGSKSTGVP